MKYMIQVEDRIFVVEVANGTITIDGQAHDVDIRRIESLSLYSLLIDNLSHEVLIEKGEHQYQAMLRGKLYTVQVHDARTWEASRADKPVDSGETAIKAPMPGLVLKVHAAAGQTKQKGDVLVVLESMKMKVDISCPRDGTVQAVHVVAHDHVTQGQALVTVSAEK